MIHHFADLLDREGDYWTIVPNIKRYAYSADKRVTNKASAKILTISKYDKHWQQVFELKNLEELTLHEPSKEQIEAIQKVRQITRLRITHLRTNDIEFIGSLHNVEELILEYVSGFSDLSPLRKLKKLKSLHFENLRGVKNFDGLKGIKSLKYLSINGTLDWNQPIKNFSFLTGLPKLEVFWLGFVTNKSAFPAFLPILKLKHLKKISVGRSTFQTKEYAFLETAFPKVEDCSWELCWKYNDTLYFLGKRAGWVNSKSPKAKEKREEFAQAYEEMKKECKAIIRRYR